MFEELESFNYKRFLRTRREFVIAIVLGLASVFLVLVVIRQQITMSNTLRKQAQSESEVVEKLESKLRALEEVQSLPLFSREEQIHTVLPSRKPVFQLLSSLKEISEISGVYLSDINLSPGLLSTGSATVSKTEAQKKQKSTAGAEEMLITLKATGRRRNMNQFLENVNRISPLSDVTKLKINTTGSILSLNDNTAEFESELEISSYFFQKSIAAQVEEALPEIGAKEQNALNALDDFYTREFSQPETIIEGGLIDLFETEGFEFN